MYSLWTFGEYLVVRQLILRTEKLLYSQEFSQLCIPWRKSPVATVGRQDKHYGSLPWTSPDIRRPNTAFQLAGSLGCECCRCKLLLPAGLPAKA